IAGYSALNSKGEFVIKRGMDFAVLNCTNKSNNVQLSSSKYTNFRVMIAPGSYSKGLKITICDAVHQAVFVNTDAVRSQQAIFTQSRWNTLPMRICATTRASTTLCGEATW
ncbi:MAG: hypothetical protein IIW44_04910, partial [Alistipes sp.]|nr:hypothetical protein [Alistipes sp.]